MGTMLLSCPLGTLLLRSSHYLFAHAELFPSQFPMAPVAKNDLYSESDVLEIFKLPSRPRKPLR